MQVTPKARLNPFMNKIFMLGYYKIFHDREASYRSLNSLRANNAERKP